MTKKDYVRIAAVIDDCRADWSSPGSPYTQAVLDGLARKFARILAADNGKFDRIRFLAAAGVLVSCE